MKDISHIPLQNCEYDLVNISLIGYDPVTGRSFEECDDEWREASLTLQRDAEQLRWWDIIERFRLARRISIMAARQGLSQ